MSEDAVETFDVRGLNQILKALKSDTLQCRVGILHDSARHSYGATSRQNLPTNAELGAIHEFGTSKIPARSFLRIPIQEHLEEELGNSELLDEQALKEVVQTGKKTSWLKAIAKAAKAVVEEGFATSGYGKWAPWSHPHDHGSILVRSGQLRDAISSEIK